MQKIKDVLIIAVLGAACFALIYLGLASKEMSGVAREVQVLVSDTNQKLDGTFRNVNAILVQAGLVAARVEDASRTLRESAKSQAKYWDDMTKSTTKLMDNANQSIDNLTVATASLNRMIEDTNAQLNNHLMPATEETMVEARKSLTNMTESAKILADDSKMVMDDLHRILSSEDWENAVKGIAETTNNAAAASAEVAEAAQELPSVARSMEKIAKTSSKWQKLQIPISIFSLIYRTFF